MLFDAAILTLGVTVGTWVINFVAAVHGGIWERIAGFTRLDRGITVSPGVSCREPTVTSSK